MKIRFLIDENLSPKIQLAVLSLILKGTVEQESLSLDNLWENPPPATGEMKLTIAEFKSKYNRSDRWDEDFVL